MGWAVGLLVAVWLGIAVWAAVWALRSRREHALADAAASTAAALAAASVPVDSVPAQPAAPLEVDLTGADVDLTARQERVQSGDDDARRL